MLTNPNETPRKSGDFRSCLLACYRASWTPGTPHDTMIRFEDSRVEVKPAAKDVVRILSTSLLVTPAVFRFVCPGRYFCGCECG